MLIKLIKVNIITFLLIFFIFTKIIYAHEINKDEARSILNDLNIEYSVDAICEAADKDDVKIIELFHLSGVSLDTECSIYGTTLLFNAVDRGSERVFRYLIDKGADINNFSKLSYKTVFIEALSNSRYDWAYELLNLGVDTRQKKPEGSGINDMTALGYTLLECDNSLLKAVLRNGANPNESNGISKALALVPRNCSAMIMTLIKAGADIDSYENANNTPLIDYIIYNNYEYVEILLKNGANPNIEVDGRDAALWAVSQNNLKILLLLQKYNVDLKKIYLIDDTIVPYSLRENKNLVKKITTQGLSLMEISNLMGFSNIYNFLINETGTAS